MLYEIVIPYVTDEQTFINNEVNKNSHCINDSSFICIQLYFFCSMKFWDDEQANKEKSLVRDFNYLLQKKEAHSGAN